MAITQSALARAMAHDVVRVAPPETGIKRIWVWSQHGYVDPERDYVELTVMHGPLDDETLHRFLTAVADMTDERYPEVNTLMHTFSSDEVAELDLQGEVRPGAEEIELVDE